MRERVCECACASESVYAGVCCSLAYCERACCCDLKLLQAKPQSGLADVHHRHLGGRDGDGWYGVREGGRDVRHCGTENMTRT